MISTNTSLISNLEQANLSNANLWRASLRGANLVQTDLSEANLTKTDLNQANFNPANLYKTDMTEADCGYTVFGNIDLSEVIGLETIHHRHPSILDIMTLYNSHNTIPDILLQGCGLPEQLVKFVKSLTHD